MSNTHVEARINGITRVLLAKHGAGASLSSSSKGREREDFIDELTANALGPAFRVCDGDITDVAGNRSGQLDGIIEITNSISFSTGGSTRLCLAEAVCAVIEVKSDLSNQWSEVDASNKVLSVLKRNFTGPSLGFGSGSSPSILIPHFAIGYIGWSKMQTLANHLHTSGLEGLLTLDPPIFVEKTNSGITYWDDWKALFAFFCAIQRKTTELAIAQPNYLAYT